VRAALEQGAAIAIRRSSTVAGGRLDPRRTLRVTTSFRFFFSSNWRAARMR
jgi:hypothetical protein